MKFWEEALELTQIQVHKFLIQGLSNQGNHEHQDS